MVCYAHETFRGLLEKKKYFRFYGYDEEWKGLILFGRFTCVFIFWERTMKFIAAIFEKWAKLLGIFPAFNKLESTEWIESKSLTFRWMVNQHKWVVKVVPEDCWTVLPCREAFSPEFFPSFLRRHSRQQQSRQHLVSQEISAALLPPVLAWMRLFDQVEVERWTAVTQFLARRNPLILHWQTPISTAVAANEAEP